MPLIFTANTNNNNDASLLNNTTGRNPQRPLVQSQSFTTHQGPLVKRQPGHLVRSASTVNELYGSGIYLNGSKPIQV
jgi:hypothetical protein